VLLDSKGDIKLAVPNGKEILGPGAKKLVAEAMRTRKVIFSDLYRNKTTRVIRLSVVVPLLGSRGHETLPVGALILRIDPFHFLYPLIQTWPTQSPTAETLLIRREGDGVLFLNELRHQKNTALSLQLPVGRKTLPAAMAVMGQQGIVEGLDYRGVPVLAALRAIPDSSWFLVAKVDRSEVFAPIRERFWMVTVMVSILIFSSALSVVLFWRYQRAVELRKYRERLEEEIADRTHELREVNEELESFSYSVSHDLRAPLRAIDGFSRAVTEDYEDKLDEEGKRLLKVISDNAQKMGQLIDDLLTFSRIGRQEIKRSRVEMEDLARTVFEEIKAILPGRRIQLNITAMPPARGDRAMVRQIFVNLLSNAVKFTKMRENAILEVGCKSGENENIYFVKDNGVGFDMRYVEKLFCVFQRLHGSEEFEGTGVGLAIVQRIVRRHGGRVWAEGKVNEGAVFYFTLPANTAGDEKDADA
jgi:two-component system sensor kinase